MMVKNKQQSVAVVYILLIWVTLDCTAIDVTNIIISSNKLAQTVSQKFLSVAVDTGMIRHNWEKLNFSSPKIETLAKALAPCFVRIGGTEADFMTFSPETNNIVDRSGSFLWNIIHNKFVNFTMSGNQWDELNKFVEKVGWDMIFDLNSLQRNNGKWLPDNAELLMEYTSKKNYKIAGWELGNEPNSYKHHLGYSIDSSVRAQDYTILKGLLNQYPQWRDCVVIGPSTTQVGKKSARKYFQGFLEAEGPDIVTNPTFHHYYVNGREASVDDFVDPDIMDSLTPQIQLATQIAKHPPYGRVWLGETGSAYGGGAPGLSDRYAAGFLWLDKLGVSAVNGLDTLIRQSFYGGHYALIDHDTLDPNPDFWLSYLYKTLVGEGVLKVDVGGQSRSLRMYAHCSNTKKSKYPVGSVTLYGMNLNNSSKTIILKQFGFNVKLHVYLLQPPDGNLNSQEITLNKRTLKLNRDYSLPNILTPTIQTGKFTFPPQSFGFIVLPSINFTIC